MSFIPFLDGDFQGRSPSFDSSRTINLYLEASESGTSRSPAMLIGTPGLKRWTTLDGGGIRGCEAITQQIAIVVSGPNVWKVTTGKAATLLGTIADLETPISMAYNGTVAMLVDGPNGYFIDPNGGVTQITDPAFEGADRVDFIDGYFAWNKPDTGQFQITTLYGTDIDALDFATAEGGPDNLVTLIVDHRELWLLGEDTTEVWYNSGDVDFPFQRIQGAFLEVGCAAAMSVAKADNSIFWLARDDRGFGTVQRAAGYVPQRVSNHAVEYAIARYERIDDAIAYTYSQEGHTFYMLSFPSAEATWCFDISSGRWHERAYRYSDGTLGRHRSNCQMNFAGLTLVGDWEDGRVYEMDLDTFTDDGDLIPAIRACPHIAADGKFVLHTALELFMQTGVGLPDGQGSNPQAMLQYSDDGGYSWSNERWVSIGKIGERKARVRWTRLGKSRDRVYRVVVTDPIRRVFTSASLTTLPCAA